MAATRPSLAGRDRAGHLARAALLALVVAACGPDRVIDGIAIEGTRWIALDVAGLRPVVGHSATLEFPGGEGPVSGSTGCNDYSWTYRSLPGGAISVAGLSQSVHGCDGNDARTRQDDRFLGALKSAQRIDIVEGRLVISTRVGTLVFERIAPNG